MCDSLYVKANGEFPCWSGVGESLALQVIDEPTLAAGEGVSLFHSPELVAIRTAFLEGRNPHPDLCPSCSVRRDGVMTSIRPKTMRVLHVEPAYLCDLACPECILPKDRLRLKRPPYYMTLSYYAALLRRLRGEGVEAIRIVQFEGRGEPLLNRRLGEMVRLTRETYPESFIQITTHGNFPFEPWMLDVDLLTLSVDGAFAQSYARYRVGGKLEKALDLMAAIRDHKRKTQSSLRVRWKYILFEWNDGDREMLEAGRLAEELEAELCFTLTHTAGKSQRFRSVEELRIVLADLQPRATTYQTPELKPDRAIGYLSREYAEGFLLSALKRLRGGDREAGRSAVAEALTFDPGLSADELEGAVEELVGRHLDRILAEASPSTVNLLADVIDLLAGMSYSRGKHESAERLYRLYLDLVPDGADSTNAVVRSMVSRAEIRWVVLKVGNRLGRSRALVSLWSKRPTKWLLRAGLGPALRWSIGRIFRVFRRVFGRVPRMDAPRRGSSAGRATASRAARGGSHSTCARQHQRETSAQ